MTKGLVAANYPLNIPADLTQASFQRQEKRWTVIPTLVMSYHQKLIDTMRSVKTDFEDWDLNQSEGEGQLGIIAPGYAYNKLRQVLKQSMPQPLRIMKLSTLHPLPERRIARFLKGLDAVLIIEETAPYFESQVRGIAYRAGLQVSIYGRNSGHIPDAGELFPQHISDALLGFLTDWSPPPSLEQPERHMISTEPLCEGCPYIPGFGMLLQVIEHHGWRVLKTITWLTRQTSRQPRKLMRKDWQRAGCRWLSSAIPAPFLLPIIHINQFLNKGDLYGFTGTSQTRDRNQLTQETGCYSELV